jgi:UDP-N-acetylmuramoyl-L-alanyl-D-glutamate--2,6-diaminopimelate ligase
MRFDELIQAVSETEFWRLSNVEALLDTARWRQREIRSVQCDSRRVGPGDIFVAIPGTAADGHDYIPRALRRGAEAVVAERLVETDDRPLIVVTDSRRALSFLCDAIHNSPARAMKVIGVTGTNGKTTTSFLLRSIIHAAGSDAGMIGTIGWSSDGAFRPTSHTTPDPPDLHRMLAEFRRHGRRYAILEASSHALDQRRLDGIPFAAGIFTNLSPEHLDYHETMEQYREAKATLFRQLPPSSVAVLRWEDSASRYFAGVTRARTVCYGAQGDVRIRASNLEVDGSMLEFLLGDRPVKTRVHLPGSHNIQNALAAAAAAWAMGIPPEAIAEGIRAMRRVPGRLEKVEEAQGFSVFVDYAHTDDALQKVLMSLRQLASARIIVVFGCGGDRDATKRPRMGRVAERLADRTIITSDNPRSEPPMTIIADILRGMKDKSRRVVIPDRRKAIAEALAMAREGDVVLIAGKGHEPYQIVGSEVREFDDRRAVREILAGCGDICSTYETLSRRWE